MDNTKKPPTVLSLCTGYGGIERGLERVFGEIRVLAHVEIEAFAIANLVNKMETGRMVPAPIWTDIKTLKPGLFRGIVDILTGGYPCQPFSAAGKRKGSEDPRHLWPFVRETIIACEPRWVFLENVEGHISQGIAEVLSDLEKMAYKVECGIFSAAEVGAPHQRKRVFILAKSASEPDNRRIHREVQNQKSEWRSIDTETVHCGTDELAHSESADGWIAKDWIRHEAVRESSARRTWKASSEQAHSVSEGSQGHTRHEQNKTGQTRAWQDRPITEGCLSLWPSRPGEPQHEWEAPRVVANTPSAKWGPGCNIELQTPFRPPRNNEFAGESWGKTQSGLGRAVDGLTDRVDRLRLLGNGVVPQTAEHAFRSLYYAHIPSVS